MKPIFKQAMIADYDLLLELIQQFYQFEGISFNEKITNVLALILNNQEFGRVWLIQLEEQICGYLVLTFAFSLEYWGKNAYVDEVFILPEYRGKGLGTQALNFVEDIAHSLEIQTLHLEVSRNNIKAQELYRKLGYQDHSRYLMTKWLE